MNHCLCQANSDRRTDLVHFLDIPSALSCPELHHGIAQPH